jgi:large subunit ribosomal protein L25
MQVHKVKGEIREGRGTKNAERIRKENHVPCIIYGGDVQKSFVLHSTAFKELVYTPDFKLVEVELDGKTYKCILQDIQFHPVTDQIMHADFLNLVDGSPVKVQVPIRFDGTAEGVKQGGKLQQKKRKIKIKTLPESMIDELRVDVSHLTMGQSVRVRDVNVPEGVQIMTDPGTPLAAVIVPRALRSSTAAEQAAGADELPEEAEEGVEE